MSNYPTSIDDNNSLYLLKNQAVTYLNGQLSTSGGNNSQSNSMDVVDGTQLPATAGFVLIGTELIAYTSIVGNKLINITRGYNSTTAATHKSGDEVKLVYMADYHNALKDAIIAIENFLGTSLTHIFPKIYKQATDPAGDPTKNIVDGDEWHNTSDQQVYKRTSVSGTAAWVMIGG